MDIITHAGIGLIAAAPVLNSRPELALGLVAGSVLPDLDALSRVFGKRAFLRSHQTWSHALPLQAAVSVLAGFLASACGADGLLLGAGLLGGFVIHTLLDFSNTLGVTLLAPFSRKRLCLEWVFFIDAFVLTLTVAMAGFSLWLFYRNGDVPIRYAGIFFGTTATYFVAKGFLRRRAGAFAADAVTLVPSALWPWRFFGATECGNWIRQFQINSITGSRKVLAEQEVFDAAYAGLLASVPEFILMRSLSAAYHVVSATETEAGEVVVCRDLRTRNFGTTYGDLEVLLDKNHSVLRTKLHV
ncbi:Membrane-bound metal-dependent hydrolase [Verrucomicrobia bacterium]|nr:Membrane-bound metal-dependent hydrolase [Verrucomicrobiota bacterium]